MKPNIEFSIVAAFYVTNIVTIAFEFPLHNRLERNPKDIVAIFCFEMDLKNVCSFALQIFHIKMDDEGHCLVMVLFEILLPIHEVILFCFHLTHIEICMQNLALEILYYIRLF